MIYKFEQTHTDRYFFEVEAKSMDEAFMKLKDLTIEDATGHKNIDIYTRATNYGEVIEDDRGEDDIRDEAKIISINEPLKNK